MSQPIDAVISWVDGYDPDYQKKLNDFCKQTSLVRSHVIEPTRIQQSNEIYYCLHGLRRFAPWLRHIYLLTNAQKPRVLDELADNEFAKKIKLIDQNELLSRQGINTPVFNSLSVEWLMWHIPDLSNQFLYLNDDFFIIRDVKPEDFFRQGRLVLRGEWKVQTVHKWRYFFKRWLSSQEAWSSFIYKANPHRYWQEQSAKMAGYDRRFYLLPHAPFPLLKSTYDAYAQVMPELFNHNAGYPFRHQRQLSSIPLMVHNDIKLHRVVYDEDKCTVTVHGSAHSPRKIKARLSWAARNKQVAFICMQSIDEAPSAVRDMMKAWLEQQLNVSY